MWISLSCNTDPATVSDRHDALHSMQDAKNAVPECRQNCIKICSTVRHATELGCLLNEASIAPHTLTSHTCRVSCLTAPKAYKAAIKNVTSPRSIPHTNKKKCAASTNSRRARIHVPSASRTLALHAAGPLPHQKKQHKGAHHAGSQHKARTHTQHKAARGTLRGKIKICYCQRNPEGSRPNLAVHMHVGPCLHSKSDLSNASDHSNASWSAQQHHQHAVLACVPTFHHTKQPH